MNRTRYDDIAAFYDRTVGDRLDDNAGTATLLGAAGNVEGVRVLDLACGQGRLARALARRGAAVVGADISASLIDIAGAAEAAEPLGIRYVQVDATSPGALSGEVFDQVVCNFGLSDIDDLGAVLATVGRVLAPGGAFVFSILHPCFPGWGVDAPSSWPPGSSYFDEGWWRADNPGFRGKVGAHHRTLATYINAPMAVGLELERLIEPPPAEWPAPAPTVPVYLVICWRCRRRSDAMPK
jgi:2-polyprenyl-3-methyl-5-hydroxy-6-metoxy-1,4-benzoquinol methylase